jgi:hypothetical protein
MVSESTSGISPVSEPPRSVAAVEIAPEMIDPEIEALYTLDLAEATEGKEVVNRAFDAINESRRAYLREDYVP